MGSKFYLKIKELSFISLIFTNIIYFYVFQKYGIFNCSIIYIMGNSIISRCSQIVDTLKSVSNYQFGILSAVHPSESILFDVDFYMIWVFVTSYNNNASNASRHTTQTTELILPSNSDTVRLYTAIVIDPFSVETTSNTITTTLAIQL